MRWLEYSEGPSNLGVRPVRKSIHLVIGGAIHSGTEVLLKESQDWLNTTPDPNSNSSLSPLLADKLDFMFNSSNPGVALGNTVARQIEDAAVAAALKDLAESTKLGIVLDDNESPDAKAKPPTTGSAAPSLNDQLRMSIAMEESPMMITFGDEEPAESPISTILAPADFSAPIYTDNSPAAPDNSDLQDERLAQIEVVTQQAATGMDDYLKEELAALIEAMIRAYARRRLRPLLEQFEVLEVEREGQWKLGEAEGIGDHDWYSPSDDPDSPWYDTCSKCSAIRNSKAGMETCRYGNAELWFMSRLDALLLERSTGQLYLQSYKTTGAWDRRKAEDAQVDMQGLTEAVDVDNRLYAAWNKIHTDCQPTEEWKMSDVVSDPVRKWLCSLSEPPRVLGVRYEYLLKGPRRQDKKDPQQPGRYVADTPLIRAWMQEGITGSDRRWGHSYTVYDVRGKGKNLDYRSWRKVPVWRHMTILQWIDRLDANLVQPEGLTEEGYPVDILAEQFIQPIHVFRNDDDLRDMLEQLEAKEIRVAQNVAAVKAVEHDPALKRSELNQRFPQNRSACSYPGKCSMFFICYGSAEMRHNPLQSELYKIREINHPVEVEGIAPS